MGFGERAGAAGAPSRVIREIENTWIPLADGTRLAARIWLPEDAEDHPVPAILEYLPYRKDDCTAQDDARRHPYFAGHGYAAVRVDLRGTGDSDGLLLGEYLKQEQDDALEVLAWLEARAWCTGAVGMIGYSWGGFNGLQIAARQPPQLAAVITVDSTDDRYLDDCHYMGGCLLASDMLKWAASMLTYPIQPPDPRFVGDRWREMWLERLENAPELARDWLSHQRRDAFWEHGSVAEDHSAIKCPVLAVGGWADAYTNAVPRLLEHLDVPRLGIIGPWAHMMPHTGVPGPAIGFLREALRWWDRWLKGIENDVMDEPTLRVWMQEHVTPATFHAERPGRWVGVASWPRDAIATREFALRADGGLGEAAPDDAPVAIVARQGCGQAAGVWCANGYADEIAGDQRPDDERSLTFDTETLAEPLEVLGRPVARLRLRSDRPLALVSARLEDVAPDGTSLLVSWGMLNLAHRDSHAHPEPLVPGDEYDIEVAMRVCGHRFEAGHVIRLALSPAYWPHAWPSPEAVTLGVALDGSSALELPTHSSFASEGSVRFGPPETLAPTSAPDDSAERTRRVESDPATGRHTIRDTQRLARTVPGTGTRYSESGTDEYSIVEGDPLSAAVRCERETCSESAGAAWCVRVVSEMVCDETSFHVTETYAAHEGESEVFSRTRRHRIPRDHL